MNMNLLRDTGQLTESGLRRTPDGGLNASWALSWPEQQAAGIEPIVLQAYFGGGFRPRLAVERVQRRGCGGPAIHTPGDRVERSAQSRLPFGLSDRSCGDGKSRQPARPWSQSNLIPAIGIFSSTAQTSPHIPGKAPATPHATEPPPSPAHAFAHLPRLRRQSPLAPVSRDCFVLRILLGVPSSTCAAVPHHG
jgi:hypothetical protein